MPLERLDVEWLSEHVAIISVSVHPANLSILLVEVIMNEAYRELLMMTNVRHLLGVSRQDIREGGITISFSSLEELPPPRTLGRLPLRLVLGSG